MPNLEQVKVKTMETLLTPAEAKEILASFKKLGDKMILVDNMLRTLENKLENDKSLRKDEKAELEQVFLAIEAQKKAIGDHMNTPAGRTEIIDEQLRELDNQLENDKSLRKDEKDVLIKKFEDLEAEKRSLTKPEAPKVETPPVVAEVKEEETEEGPTEEEIGEAEPEVESKPEIVTPAVEVAPEPVRPEMPPAQVLAQKIKNKEPLSKEDEKYRSEHWGEVVTALIRINRAPGVSNDSRPTGSIERLNPTPKEATAEVRVERKTPQEKVKEYAEKREKNLQPETEKQPAVVKERVEKAKKQVEAAKKHNKNKGMGWLYYAGLVPASPTIAGGIAGDIVHGQIMNAVDILKKKFNKEFGDGKEKKDELKLKTNGDLLKESLQRRFGGEDKNKEKSKKEPGAKKESPEPKESNPGNEKIKKIEGFVGEPMNKEDVIMWTEVKKMKAAEFFKAADTEKLEDANNSPFEKKLYEKLVTINDRDYGDMTFEEYLESLMDKQDKKTAEELKVKEEKEKKEKETTKRVNEFLEKGYGKKMEGDMVKKWEKLGKIPLGTFFHPDNLGKTPEDFKEEGMYPIYEKLLPLYEKEDADNKDKIELKDFIKKLAEKDLLKDLWTQTSSSSS